MQQQPAKPRYYADTQDVDRPTKRRLIQLETFSDAVYKGLGDYAWEGKFPSGLIQFLKDSRELKEIWRFGLVREEVDTECKEPTKLVRKTWNDVWEDYFEQFQIGTHEPGNESLKMKIRAQRWCEAFMAFELEVMREAETVWGCQPPPPSSSPPRKSTKKRTVKKPRRV